MGSKSAKKAQSTGAKASTQNGNASTGQVSCPLAKHFFKIKVIDTAGNPVPEAKPRLQLSDSSDLNPVTLTPQGMFDTTRIIETTGQTIVSFPTMADGEWWPQGEPPTDIAADGQVTIADGDCALKVAADAGVRDYKTIWKHSKNATLVGQHPNPNALVVGDVLWVPNAKTEVVRRPLDQEATFVVGVAKPGKLKLVVVDKELKPINNWDWTLTTPVAKTAKTPASGLIEVPDLDAKATAGALKLKKPAPPPPPSAPPSGPAVTTPPYPPAIVPANYKDKNPEKPDGSDTFEWTLKIGSLPSHKEKKGVLARLHNLGFNCDVDSDDTKLTAAVKSFQKVILKEDAPSGLFADIEQSLEDQHSKA